MMRFGAEFSDLTVTPTTTAPELYVLLRESAVRLRVCGTNTRKRYTYTKNTQTQKTQTKHTNAARTTSKRAQDTKRWWCRERWRRRR